MLTPLQCLVTADQVARVMPEVAAIKKDVDQFERRRERWLVGWVCYLMAITQYLIIGLVTRRDKALDMLNEFDRAVAERRQELVEEFKEEGNLPKDFDPAIPISPVPPQDVRDKAEQETDV